MSCMSCVQRGCVRPLILMVFDCARIASEHWTRGPVSHDSIQDMRLVRSNGSLHIVKETLNPTNP